MPKQINTNNVKSIDYLDYSALSLGMEHAQCPICKKSGLTPVREVKRGRIVCENEHYKHLISGQFHYLVRTKRNIVEELSLTLVTN